MKLNDGKITFKLTMESLAYLLVNEVNREELLGLLVRIAEISADSNFEWEVIERLFGHLIECGSGITTELLDALCTLEEGGD